jgi:ABC-type branched-subunit amino acid transport system substrate-binding protein
MRLPFLALATAALLLAACTEPPNTSTPTPAKPTGPQAGSPTTPSGKTRIALLLPLSGRAAGIGRSMQQAAEMSLFDSSGGKDLALAAYDSGDSAESASDAYNRARTDGCALVLGPLFGSSAIALAPLVKQGGANVISFSNDEKAAQPGVWIMGIAAPPQVRRVVAYAVSQGIRRFAAFAPRTAYGDQMTATLQDEAAARGATVVGVEQFDPRSLDLTGAAKRLATDIGAGDSKVAVLMPVAPPQLSPALASLQAAEIDTSKIQLIGTGVWDAPNVGSNATLRGAWYAAPDPARRADFERKYLATYGRPPERLATLAYDAVALAAQLVRGKSGVVSADAITSPNGWTGVDGPIRFLPDGRSQRALAVIEIQGDRSVVISPAPSSFSQVTN